MDVHASDNLCWGYTALLVVLQIFAFGRVSKEREDSRVKAEARMDEGSAVEWVEGKAEDSTMENCIGEDERKSQEVEEMT